MDSFLKILAKLSDWRDPDIRALRGRQYKGLSELRWESGNVQHRLIGCTVADHVYLMLIGCTHKQRRYNPPEALETAVNRKRKLELGEATTSEYRLFTDH